MTPSVEDTYHTGEPARPRSTKLSGRGVPFALAGLSLGLLVAAPSAFSQSFEAFLHRFGAGQPVSAKKLNHNFDTLRASTVPVGAILPFAGEAVPPGWLLCDGSTVSEAEFPELAAALGNAWGVAAAGSIVLPDLRGQFLRGAHDPRGVDATPNRAVGSLQGEQLGSHSHGVGGHAHNVNVGNAVNVPTFAAVVNGSIAVRGLNDEGARRSTEAGAGNTGAVGGETRPDNAAVNYIIRASVLIEP